MIRDAAPRDYQAISALITDAFKQTDEADLVSRLRDDGDVLFELVAANDIAVQGHILFSRLRIERAEGPLEAAALAPVSVLPSFQRQGIGAALVDVGKARCAALGVPAIIVVGHADYYPRFGFSAETAASLDTPFPGPHFMALELSRGVLRKGGRVRYASAFGIEA